MSVDFIVGGLARNEDFCFRKEFIDDLWVSLRKENVLLIAPRRMGKTSVMFHLLDNPRNGYRVIHLNVESLETPAGFFISLIDAINEHQPNFLRQYLARSWELLTRIGDWVEEIEFLDFKLKLKNAANWDQGWRELSQQFMERILESGEPLLFIIDELPDMLSAMKEKSAGDLQQFLHIFRRMRQTPEDSRVRWLVGGSVNIRGTLDDLGLIRLINDFKTEILPPFDNREVEDFTSMMLRGREVRYDGTVIPRIRHLLGEPIPFFMQLLIQELYRYWRRNRPEVLTYGHVDHVFRHALLGQAAQDKLQHYHSRIGLHYPRQERDAAFGLLDRLSLAEGGIGENALFQLYGEVEASRPAPRAGQVLKQAFKRLMLPCKATSTSSGWATAGTISAATCSRCGGGTTGGNWGCEAN